MSGIIARRALSGRAHMAGALNADVLPNLPTGCIWELAHTDAGIWHKVTTAWPRTKVLGVTAAPERLDGLELPGSPRGGKR